MALTPESASTGRRSIKKVFKQAREKGIIYKYIILLCYSLKLCQPPQRGAILVKKPVSVIHPVKVCQEILEVILHVEVDVMVLEGKEVRLFLIYNHGCYLIVVLIPSWW